VSGGNAVPVTSEKNHDPARGLLRSQRLLLLSTSASSVIVDLVDGAGSLTWDRNVSVTSPSDNTSVTHPLFPGNRHPHEGWFIYLDDFMVLHEFTSFTSTSDGASQDSLSSTLPSSVKTSRSI